MTERREVPRETGDCMMLDVILVVVCVVVLVAIFWLAAAAGVSP